MNATKAERSHTGPRTGGPGGRTGGTGGPGSAAKTTADPTGAHNCCCLLTLAEVAFRATAGATPASGGGANSFFSSLTNVSSDINFQ